MIMRVPRRRSGVKESLSKQIEVLKEIMKKSDMNELIESMFEKIRSASLEEIVPQIRDPRPYDQIGLCIYKMAWQIEFTDGPDFFLIGDSPVFYRREYGFCTTKSEFTFPISRKMTIIGSHHGTPFSTYFVPCSQKEVREVNKRIISESVQYIFYYKREDRIKELSELLQ